EGLSVEVFTLPYDSINPDIRAQVMQHFQWLEKNGAKIYLCAWNVGDPERTITAVGRWYSFHGKFIVTDESAIALSANFTMSRELDAIIIFKNDQKRIVEFNKKFDELIDLFITTYGDSQGSIRKNILETRVNDIESVFQLPRIIESTTHRQHWVRHYPSQLCPEKAVIEDRLYLIPFDARGRLLFEEILNEASDFIYISTESFTDPDFPKLLRRLRLEDIEIKIITGAKSMDYQERIQEMLREMLAQRIGLRTTTSDLHAKLIVTDKRVVISSINLNRMNLGFHVTRKYWRGNTETVLVSSEPDVIKKARQQFLVNYDTGKEIGGVLAQKIENTVGRMLSSTFGLKSKREVKTLFARLIIMREIDVKRLVIEIGKIAAKLMKTYRRNTIEIDDFVSALVLYFLSERKQDYDELNVRLQVLNVNVNLDAILSGLINGGFIEKSDDFYKIKLTTLLGR
ncbi:MAG: phospholipase D family protein, partial [Nitrososphaerales archaeon]